MKKGITPLFKIRYTQPLKSNEFKAKKVVKSDALQKTWIKTRIEVINVFLGTQRSKAFYIYLHF